MTRKSNKSAAVGDVMTRKKTAAAPAPTNTPPRSLDEIAAEIHHLDLNDRAGIIARSRGVSPPIKRRAS
jgi:hypothetical protein